jgi:hypothetical protein
MRNISKIIKCRAFSKRWQKGMPFERELGSRDPRRIKTAGRG